MTWEMFWITAIVVVLILIIASQIASVRAWASRVFGRVMPGLPNFGALGGALSLVSGKAWFRLMLIPLVIGGILAVVEFTKHQGRLEERLKAERANVIVANHETDLAGKAIVLAEETHRDRTRREAVIAQAEQEIEDAVSQADFDRLYRAYALGYCGLLDLPECEDRPDPSPSGPPRLRSAPADRA